MGVHTFINDKSENRHISFFSYKMEINADKKVKRVDCGWPWGAGLGDWVGWGKKRLPFYVALCCSLTGCMYTLGGKAFCKNKTLLRTPLLLCLTSKYSIFSLPCEWNMKTEGWSLEQFRPVRRCEECITIGAEADASLWAHRTGSYSLKLGFVQDEALLSVP